MAVPVKDQTENSSAPTQAKIALHTPGPWKLDPEYSDEITTLDGRRAIAEVRGGRFVSRVAGGPADVYEIPAEVKANARLIAAAPDHALFAAALCQGVVRWEPFHPWTNRGEICCGGLRYTTTLDDFGVPVLGDHTRTAIQKARGGHAS